MIAAEPFTANGLPCEIEKRGGKILACSFKITFNGKPCTLRVEKLECDFRCAVGEQVIYSRRVDLADEFGDDVAQALEEVFPRVEK